jgi:FtsP/CotA-like multicopper oxidase with cupredoxin domain
MPDHPAVTSRRSFFQVGAGTALLCTIGGEQVDLGKPGAAARADAAAARVPRPPLARAGAAAEQFPAPQPAPGGQVREYWIQARTAGWNIVPTGRDDWHGRTITGRTSFRAYVYQEMTEGFAEAKGALAMPGPTLYAEVGDLLVVHFRNADTKLRQAVTMHPHGVRYNPEYDGAYMGRYTRAGGFVAPGEEFTYRWECVPGSAGAWPYHDHGPNHALNTARGLFGAIVITEPGEKLPDVSYALVLHELTPPITGLGRAFQCINGRAYAGNTPTLRSKPGQDVALHVFGMDSNFHDFHMHGHRWRDTAGAPTDTSTVGPSESLTARFTEDNPGRWLYHCHVFTHQDEGMAGWYEVAV